MVVSPSLENKTRFPNEERNRRWEGVGVGVGEIRVEAIPDELGGKQDSNQVETDVPVSGFCQTFHIQSVRGFLVEPCLTRWEKPVEIK